MISHSSLRSLTILFLVVGTFAWSISVHAQESFFSAGEGLDKISLSLEHQGFASAESDAGAGQSVAIEEQRAAVSFPVFKSESDTLAFTARGQRTLVNRSLRFNERNVDLPREFGTAEVGLAFGRKRSDTDRFGLSATIGTAGTSLLEKNRTPILTGGFVYEAKKPDGNSWIYFVNYSNNRTFLNNIPIPGIAYSINGLTKKIVIGLPFTFLMFRPDPWLIVGVISPFFATAEVGYRFWGPLQIYTSAGWTPRAYQNLIEGSEDRLIYNKKEIAAGIRAFFGPKGSLSLGYVREFDRRFMLGKSVGNHDADDINVDASGGLQLKARLSL